MLSTTTKAWTSNFNISIICYYQYIKTLSRSSCPSVWNPSKEVPHWHEMTLAKWRQTFQINLEPKYRSLGISSHIWYSMPQNPLWNHKNFWDITNKTALQYVKLRYGIYADSGVYKQKIAHKTASNQPLWKAWPQAIVTAASLVTSWLPLWCHSDAYVTKSWQYASL